MTLTSFVTLAKALYYGTGSRGLFVRWFLIFLCILIAAGSWALFRIVAAEQNPFLYADF